MQTSPEISTELYADIVFDRPLDHAYSYSVPHELADRIAVGKRVEASFGRGDKGTVGYCVAHAGEIVAEAVAGPFARGIAEIGVGTKPQHRGRGLATAAAARLLQACEELGFRPLWNAAQHNAPSVALARRLGFVIEQPFEVYA